MSDTKIIQTDEVIVRFAGDSGDGMQITGTQFTETAARIGNDLATFPDFPAEIRAPAGTRPGVSAYQIHFSSSDIHTPGDRPDALVALNPAALVVNLPDLKTGGIVVVNTGSFTEADLKKAHLDSNPLEDGTLEGFRVVKLDVNARVMDALADLPISKKEALRCKNFYVLGLMYWLYSRTLDATEEWLEEKFGSRPEIVDANRRALRAGWNRGNTLELFQGRYEVPAFRDAPKGKYRNIMGNQALSLGLITGAKLAELTPLLASYPITPATEILHNLSHFKHHGMITLQMEDEIAAVTAAIGASYAGALGMTTTSGPGMALKGEALGLAVMAELPLVVVNVQRAGPSTGMPTKVEQADLLQAVFGRNSEAPIPVLAASTPTDCFDTAIEACRLAVEYMCPVILLADNYIAAGSEPWLLPDLDELPRFPAKFPTDPENFQPYLRDDKDARPWAVPGMAGFQHTIGGLEKDEKTGGVSYDPENHERMVHFRDEKVRMIANGYRREIDVYGPDEADLLVLTWGSPYGAAREAVDRALKKNLSVAHLQIRHIWPLHQHLEEVLGRYKRILLPELNLGQFARLLWSEMPNLDIVKMDKVQGKPFFTDEVLAKIEQLLGVQS